MKNINVILFDDFTILDAFGPVEVFRCLDKIYHIDFYSMKGGKIHTAPNLEFDTKPVSGMGSMDILLVPGGLGARKMAEDSAFIGELKDIAVRSEYVLTVCTGSALLARTGLLKGIQATSNKMAFEWAVQQDSGVHWIRKARWVADGKYYSSSGVTAGIDMALGFVNDKISSAAAQSISKGLEYVWNKNREEDPFA